MSHSPNVVQNGIECMTAGSPRRSVPAQKDPGQNGHDTSSVSGRNSSGFSVFVMVALVAEPSDISWVVVVLVVGLDLRIATVFAGLSFQDAAPDENVGVGTAVGLLALRRW